MARIFTRRDILARLHETALADQPIIGTCVGNGQVASLQESRGVDFVAVCSTERYRLAGQGALAGYLPYGDANGILMEMAPEVLSAVDDIPVLADICGTDPFRRTEIFLSDIQEMGFSGVQNFPSVGLYDGFFRRLLEENGIGYDQEVSLIRLAHARDMFTCPYVFNADDARMMALAGADMLIIHLGLPSEEADDAMLLHREEIATNMEAISDAALRINPDILCLGHGGSFNQPADLEYIFRNTANIHGFYNLVHLELVFDQGAINRRTEQFKSLKIKPCS